MNEENSNYENVLKDICLWVGIGLALVSIYFSWDGLYKSVPPEKAVTAVAKWIGLLLAVGFTGLQFIFNSDFKKLNSTLFALGLVSYVYSILTNKWGISDIFGFPESISWVIAFGMDVAPEAMIAWALEDITKGDMVGNIFSKLGSLRRGGAMKSRRPMQQTKQYTFTPEQKSQDTQPKITPMPAYREQGKGSKHPFPGQSKKSHNNRPFGD